MSYGILLRVGVFALMTAIGACAPLVVRGRPPGPLVGTINPKAIVRVQMRLREETSEGSGYFISPNGCICAAYHVIEKAIQGNAATKIFVHRGGTLQAARIVGISIADDVAIIKIQGNFPHINMPAHNPKLLPGEKVYLLFRDTRGNVHERKLTFDAIEFFWHNNVTVGAIRLREVLERGTSGGVVVRSEGTPIGHVAFIREKGYRSTLVIPHSRFLFTILMPEIKKECGIEKPPSLPFADSFTELFYLRK